MGFLGSAVAFIILISVLVVVHELGHLLAARANGVFVEAFSVGFGKVLFEYKDKIGTKWRISMLPFGGYVRMFGDADASSVKEVIPDGYTEEDMERMSIHRKKPWQKLIVAASGPIANFIFAICVFSCLSTINGVPEFSNVISVSEDSLAYESGLRTGDQIIKANDKDIKTFNEFKDIIVSSLGKDLSLEIKKEKDIQKINVKMYREKDGKIIPIKVLGVAPKESFYKKVGFLKGISLAVITTYNMAADNIKAIFQVATMKMESKNVGGVLSIFKIAADSAESGMLNFIWMLGMLSVMLGAVNLLPIPVLDGGTVLISAVEWIIGKPLHKKLIETIFMIGLIAVASLMLLGIWNDLSKFKFFVFVENLFK